MEAYTGIMNVYKEKGYTSHDVVAKLRGILGMKKIGHTGTLDPEATGVLPICVGRATKVCALLTDWDKTYRAGLLLGITTDTQDVTGTLLQKRTTDALTGEQVTEELLRFCGEYEQIPPMYSALKVGGKRLYELAREGKEVMRKPRTVQIKEIVIESIALPRVEFTVTCSKGTYIRTLCHDVGERLGCGGVMETLLRTRVGLFSQQEAFSLEEIQQKKETGKLSEVLYPVDYLFREYPKAIAGATVQKRIENGNPLPVSQVAFVGEETVEHGGQYRIYNVSGQFLGIYEYRRKQKEFYPVALFGSPTG